MDNRLPQPAGCGNKYDVSGLGSGLLRVARNDAERNNIAFKGLDVVRQCASKFFKTAEYDKNARRFINVLSIGGIAGYSKMMKQNGRRILLSYTWSI